MNPYIPAVLFVLLSLFFNTQASGAQFFAAETRPVRDTIHLEEVTVTAKENLSVSTSSFLSRTAIEHVQPFSLSDIMQLLPGGLTPDVSLHRPQYFRIRSSHTDDYTNMLGTGIWLDGMRISNNANLQLNLFSGANSENGSRGTDTRMLPLCNIESVEVIRGIPSARYGDISSGTVLVRSRASQMPLSVNLRATPSIKSIQAARGWNIRNAGILNISGGFTQTYADPRSREKLFRKTETTLSWTETSGSATLNARLTGSFTFESSKKEKNRLYGEYTQARHSDLSASFYGTWAAKRHLLTSLEYRASFSYAHQTDKQQTLHSQMESIGTTRMTPGEDTAFFISPNYLSLATIEGIPISASAALIANLDRNRESWQSSVSAGIEWNSEGNRGRGRLDDPTRPSTLWTRPRSYRDIPFLHSASLFAEENFSLHGQGGELALQAGIRLTGAFSANNNFFLAAEPRVNLRYSPIRSFTLKAGWGQLRKLPSFVYLFPAPVYVDRISYRHSNAATQRLAVITTDVVSDLKSPGRLPGNNKAEIGFIVRRGKAEADVTFFSERLDNGFSMQNNVRPSSSRVYRNNTPSGLPAYAPEGVTVDGIPLPYTSDTTFIQCSAPANGLSQRKTGVEYIITTGSIRAIASTLTIDGIWLRTEERNENLHGRYVPSETGGKSYPYASISENTHTRIYQRFNTNFRLITHIPALRFVSSLTLQAVWLDKNRIRYESGYDNPIYAKSDGGNLYTNPLFYMDTQGNTHPFTPAMASDSRYAPLLSSERPFTYEPNSFRPYFLINLRITKEIGQHVRLTFYANNIAAMNPSRYVASAANYTTLNPSPFYGGEVHLRF